MYSYEFVINGHHHCCLPVLINDSYVLAVLYTTHKFIKSFLKLFHSENFHFSKRVSVGKTIFAYLIPDNIQDTHKLINSLTFYDSLVTFTRIQIKLTCQSIHDTAGQKLFGVGSHGGGFVDYPHIIGHLGAPVKGHWKSGTELIEFIKDVVLVLRASILPSADFSPHKIISSPNFPSFTVLTLVKYESL